VQDKNEKILRQQMEDRYKSTVDEDTSYLENINKERQEKYRNDLLDQIQ